MRHKFAPALWTSARWCGRLLAYSLLMCLASFADCQLKPVKMSSSEVGPAFAHRDVQYAAASYTGILHRVDWITLRAHESLAPQNYGLVYRELRVRAGWPFVWASGQSWYVLMSGIDNDPSAGRDVNWIGHLGDSESIFSLNEPHPVHAPVRLAPVLDRSVVHAALFPLDVGASGVVAAILNGFVLMMAVSLAISASRRARAVLKSFRSDRGPGVCVDCGYLQGSLHVCPECGAHNRSPASSRGGPLSSAP